MIPGMPGASLNSSAEPLFTARIPVYTWNSAGKPIMAKFSPLVGCGEASLKGLSKSEVDARIEFLHMYTDEEDWIRYDVKRTRLEMLIKELQVTATTDLESGQHRVSMQVLRSGLCLVV